MLKGALHFICQVGDWTEISFLKVVTVVNCCLWTPYLWKEVMHRKDPNAKKSELDALKVAQDKLKADRDAEIATLRQGHAEEMQTIRLESANRLKEIIAKIEGVEKIQRDDVVLLHKKVETNHHVITRTLQTLLHEVGELSGGIKQLLRKGNA